MNPSTSALIPAAATPPGATTPSPGGLHQAQPTILSDLDPVIEELSAGIAKLDPAVREHGVALLEQFRDSHSRLHGIATRIAAQMLTKAEADEQKLQEAGETLRTEAEKIHQKFTDEAQRKDIELSARAAHLSKGYKWLAAGSVAGATLAVLSGLTLFRSREALKQAQGFANEGRALVQQAADLTKPLEFKLDIGNAVSRAAVAHRVMMFSDPNSKNYDTAYKALLDSVKTFKAYAQNGEISPEVRAVVERMYKGAFSIAKQAASSTGFTTAAAQQNAKTASEQIVTAWNELMLMK